MRLSRRQLRVLIESVINEEDEFEKKQMTSTRDPERTFEIFLPQDLTVDELDDAIGNLVEDLEAIGEDDAANIIDRATATKDELPDAFKPAPGQDLDDNNADFINKLINFSQFTASKLASKYEQPVRPDAMISALKKAGRSPAAASYLYSNPEKTVTATRAMRVGYLLGTNIHASKAKRKSGAKELSGNVFGDRMSGVIVPKNQVVSKPLMHALETRLKNVLILLGFENESKQVRVLQIKT